jgi:hypothetical protein
MLNEIAGLSSGERADHEQHVAAVTDFVIAAGIDLKDPQQCQALIVGNFVHCTLLVLPGLTHEEAVDRCGAAIAYLWLVADVRAQHEQRLRAHLAEHPNASIDDLAAVAAAAETATETPKKHAPQPQRAQASSMAEVRRRSEAVRDARRALNAPYEELLDEIDHLREWNKRLHVANVAQHRQILEAQVALRHLVAALDKPDSPADGLESTDGDDA